MLDRLLEIGERFTLIACEEGDVRAGLSLRSDGRGRDTNDLAQESLFRVLPTGRDSTRQRSNGRFFRTYPRNGPNSVGSYTL